MSNTDPFVCKICGRQSYETKLDCDEDNFCICKFGYGCQAGKGKFRSIYLQLNNDGKVSAPRGHNTVEIENFSVCFKPYTRFVNFDIRNLKLNYIKREFLWYLRGDKYDTSIKKHASVWDTFINDNGVINSNYGQYIFGEMNQFDNVVETLIKDPDSRRAIIMILQPYHLLREWKEVPCTYNISFRMRDNKLNMSVHMRSQDAYLGFASDIPTFSFIHEMMFITMRGYFPGLEIGTYHHAVDSFHIYENHFPFLEEVIAGRYKYNFIDCPRISSFKEIVFLRRLNYNNIPEDYKFTKWLTTFDKE